MIREKAELKWAPDSLFDSFDVDTISTKTDSSGSFIAEIDKNIEGKISLKKDIIHSEKDSDNEEKKNTEEDNAKIVAFAVPKAITLDQAYKIFKSGVIFVDSRDENDFLAGHITNSVNIPFDDFDNHKQKLELLPKDKPLVVYCGGTDCDLSHLLANLLFENGYKQVYVFFGGWNEWLEANYPVEQSSENK